MKRLIKIIAGLGIGFVAVAAIGMGLFYSWMIRVPAREIGVSDQVNTVSGPIEGVKRADGLRVFKGIPFAAPPVGELRWKAPQPVKAWTEVRSARDFGPSPMQEGLVPALFGVPRNRSEDCLYLNVWTPAKTDGERLPVMVWIYGGAFALGSSAQRLYDGSHFAAKGVVFVSFNYRVGALGFLAHPELSREGGGVSGNYGLRDQIAALQWVRDNIALFGGDPNCVTIFGESAGGQSVNILASSPPAKGLFHRVICQSGPGFLPTKSSESGSVYALPMLFLAERQGEGFFAKLKVKDLAAARALPAKAIAKGEFKPSAVIEGEVFPKDQHELYSEGNFNDTPVLVGSNSDEGAMFIRAAVKPADFIAGAGMVFGAQKEKFLALYPHATQAEATQSTRDSLADALIRAPARTWARLQTEKGKGKAFLYYFDHPAGKADHASEITYVFGHPPSTGFLRKTIKPEDQAMADLMNSYWVNFAKNGDPNGPGLPAWPAFTPKEQTVMTLDASPGMKKTPYPERLDAFDSYFAWWRTNAASSPAR